MQELPGHQVQTVKSSTSLRTPIVLITGSLGSGKTTLLRYILATTRERLAIVMNEFGELAIDSRVVAGKAARIVELAGGCVCCSLTGELEAAIEEILDLFKPDRIVVEATGVAEADSLVYEVQDHIPRVRLDGVIAIVDAHAAIIYPRMGYTERTQLEAADLVLINKADLVTPVELDQVRDQMRRANAEAALITTTHCAVDPADLFGPSLPVRRKPAPPESHQTTWQSFVFATEAMVDESCLRKVVADLPTRVFRAKGFVRLSDGARLFNYVAGRTDWEDFPADRTELVFIGQGLDAIREGILEQLSDCIQT
jgi:G3E family GTPase